MSPDFCSLLVGHTDNSSVTPWKMCPTPPSKAAVLKRNAIAVFSCFFPQRVIHCNQQHRSRFTLTYRCVSSRHQQQFSEGGGAVSSDDGRKILQSDQTDSELELSQSLHSEVLLTQYREFPQKGATYRASFSYALFICLPYCNKDAPVSASSRLLSALWIQTKAIEHVTKICGWMWQEKEKCCVTQYALLYVLIRRVANLDHWKYNPGLNCFIYMHFLFVFIHSFDALSHNLQCK